jgi:hypothetical protein
MGVLSTDTVELGNTGRKGSALKLGWNLWELAKRTYNDTPTNAPLRNKRGVMTAQTPAE